jgi:riboflavin synthase
MFTGIVEAVGEVAQVRGSSGDRDLTVAQTELAARLTLGASVAVDGVCLTVTALDGPRFTVHAIAETLRVTTVGGLRPGQRVNLETALRAGAPVGGHFVQGHVDAVGTVAGLGRQGDSVHLQIKAAPAVVAQLVPKGSVAVDGVSLTVGPHLARERFEVFLIPHTLAATTLGLRKVGDRVNLETDILGKYVLGMLQRDGSSGLRWDALRAAGYGTPPQRSGS